MDLFSRKTGVRSRYENGRIVDPTALHQTPHRIGDPFLPKSGQPFCSSERVRLVISGQVQGVGFRPFVFSLASSLGLTGFILNDSRGVTIEVQGDRKALSEFSLQLELQKPSVSRIDSLRRENVAACPEESSFLIRISPAFDENTRGTSFDSLLPDTATCPDCLTELFEPKNRRYQYPLISCTRCGPRFSIAIKPPFDRVRTTLERFPLCIQCQKEFEDPGNRRFHAQTIGCPMCGPKTHFLDGEGNPVSGGDPVQNVLQALLKGEVIAIKGIGGYHLAGDARNRETVTRIRNLKNRPNKPLAVMTGDLWTASMLAHMGILAKKALLSPERPIVLLPIKKNGPLPYDLIAPDLDRIGVFLPCTPIQHLLFGKGSFHLPDSREPLALVMTSANAEGEPIALAEKEVLKIFAGKIDGFLIHDRIIHHRQDDSLICADGNNRILLRRARGWVPQAFPVGKKRSSSPRTDSPEPFVLALGGQMKTAPCQIREGKALVFPHMGDLDGERSREEYRSSVRAFLHAQGATPTALACDLHPDFYTTRMAFEWGQEWGVPVIPVGHHHAHIASVMADRGLKGPVLGIALDGFGMGVDQTPWGGELLRVDQTDAFRLGHFRTLFLPGGDRVPREPWRMGVSALCALGRGEDAEKIFSHPQAHDLANHLKSAGQTFFPKTSSAGRLFDAAYALLGGKEQLDHEGQGAMELEVWARSFRGQNQETGNGYVISEADGQGILDFLPLLEKLRMERKKEKGAALFHETLSLGVRDFAVWGRERTGIRSIVLSGGVFQNTLLSRRVSALLGQSGFSVYRPLRVPTNDGGLSLGQAWVALSRILTDIRIKKIERRIECVLPFRHA